MSLIELLLLLRNKNKQVEPIQPNLQAKTKSYTANTAQPDVISADDGYDGLSSVSVDVNVEPALTTLNATANGTFRIGEIFAYLDYDGWDEAVINVPTNSAVYTNTFTPSGDIRQWTVDIAEKPAAIHNF